MKRHPTPWIKVLVQRHGCEAACRKVAHAKGSGPGSSGTSLVTISHVVLQMWPLQFPRHLHQVPAW